MSKVDEFVIAMETQTQAAIDETVQVLCDKYAKDEDDCEEIRRAIRGVVYIAEGMGHLKALHEEIVSNREEKHVKKE
jgi:hypothetical protein